jgi:hypothetical protein
VSRIALSAGHIPDFGIAATAIIMRLREHRITYVLDVDSEVGHDFTVMAEMGFFVQNGHFYRMTLPGTLTSEKVRTAIIEFAKTADYEFVLHPERLISTMPFSEAGTLQNRLQAIDNFCDYTPCFGRA